jgi:hypothetical protein
METGRYFIDGNEYFTCILNILRFTNIATVQAFEVVYGNENLLSWTLF